MRSLISRTWGGSGSISSVLLAVKSGVAIRTTPPVVSNAMATRISDYFPETSYDSPAVRQSDSFPHPMRRWFVQPTFHVRENDQIVVIRSRCCERCKCRHINSISRDGIFRPVL